DRRFASRLDRQTCEVDIHFGAAEQMKFVASSVLPVPFHRATCGYGHNGRVRSTTSLLTREATIFSGAIPFSTHCSRAGTGSKLEVPGPPLQCPIPGTMNSLKNGDVFAAPPIVFVAAS